MLTRRLIAAPRREETQRGHALVGLPAGGAANRWVPHDPVDSLLIEPVTLAVLMVGDKIVQTDQAAQLLRVHPKLRRQFGCGGQSFLDARDGRALR